MSHASHLLIAATASIFASNAAGQHLATYDPGANREFAISACQPAVTTLGTRDLIDRAPALHPGAGAIAADNENRDLFTATGRISDGIDRVKFSAMGDVASTCNIPAPPGFTQITGMADDPYSATRLIVTDGYSVVFYTVRPPYLTGAAYAIPLPPGTFATGVDVDVWHDDVLVVRNDATILRLALDTGSWSAQPAAFTAPSMATGIAVSRNQMTGPMLCYRDGTVMDPATGNTQPFADNIAAGPRRHRGMTFFAQPVHLGGKAPVGAPHLEIDGSFHAGSHACNVRVNHGLPSLLAIDLAAPMTGLAGILPVHGALFVDPTTSVQIMFAPGWNQLELNLANVAYGVAATVQAVGIGANGLYASEALFFQTWR
ncbi:MAG: hypothetical protein CMJ88_11030 [Planctomycetes bacterium]|nr:hypothetical protein [Planctomycetota bacterium]